MCDLAAHLFERNLQLNRYPSVYVLDDIVIFPLWNLSGQWVGYQQYRPSASKKRQNNPKDGRYYTSLHGEKNEKPLAPWGLESYAYRSDLLIITEGIFDACRFHNFNIPAVAILGSSHRSMKNWLTCTGRKVYKVDDDHASSLGPYENIDLPCGKQDAGACTDEEIEAMLKNKGIL